MRYKPAVRTRFPSSAITGPISGGKMALSKQQNAAGDATLLIAGTSHTRLRLARPLNPIFRGPNGLRVGWRLLIFLALTGIPLVALFAIAGVGGGQAEPITVTPLLLGENDAILFLMLCIVTWIMAKIEHRRFSEYGLPARQALGKDFWVGSLCGFAAISGTLLTMFLLHGFRITGLALHGTAILSSLAGWSIAFLVVGLFEEFAFRGYLQFTLASGIGFWPAAVLM